MPLRARIDNVDIFGFSYSLGDWQALKSNYRNRSLRTHCCDQKAIPKTSRLGVQFFSHARKGECTSAPETAEHLYLKFTFAQAAQRAGWKAETEVAGSTPDGEDWIADVYCSRGDARFVVEIQWTRQTTAELEARHDRYRRSGLRAAWLYRLHGRASVFDEPPHPTSYALPTFGIRFRKNERQLVVEPFHVDVEPFADALMSGRVQWRPKRPKELRGGVVAVEYECWRCHRDTTYIAGMTMEEGGHKVGYLSLHEDECVAQAIAKQIPSEVLARHQIARLRPHYSRTMQESYIANACFHCGSMAGAFYHHEVEMELAITGYPEPIAYVDVPEEFLFLIEPGWYIDPAPVVK